MAAPAVTCIPAAALLKPPCSDWHCLPLQLRHPNVVGFVGVSFHGSKGVVLMELCEGALPALACAPLPG